MSDASVQPPTSLICLTPRRGTRGYTACGVRLRIRSSSACRSGATSAATRSVFTLGHDDLADLGVDVGEDPQPLHALRLQLVVLGRRHVVHRDRLVAVDQEQLDERHQPLLAQRRGGVLVADREQAAPPPIVDVREDDVGELLAAPRPAERSSSSSEPAVCGPQLARACAPAMLVVLRATSRVHSSSSLVGTSVCTRCWNWVEPLPIALVAAVRPEVAMSAASRRGPPTSVCGVRYGDSSSRNLRCRRASASMPSCLQRGRELLGGQAVDLVPAVGDEVEHEAQLAQLLGEPAHLLVAHPGGVPVERGRQVVGQHLVGELGVDGVGEASGVLRGPPSSSPSTARRRRAPRPATSRWRSRCPPWIW